MKNSTNKAERNWAVQPCLFSDSEPVCKSGNWKRFGGWRGLSLLLLGMIVFAIWMMPTELPLLQAFVAAKVPGPKGPGRSLPRAAGRKPSVALDEPKIRVNVTPGGEKALTLDVRGKFRLVSLDREERFPADLSLTQILVTSTERGLKLGSRQTASSRIEIQPVDSPSIRVNGHLYRGRIRLFRRTDGQVSAVNELPLEEYLGSVVDSEMPAKFPVAARQAQAIVARTYALYQIEHVDSKAVFDLHSSQRSQKYLGVEYRDAAGRRLAGESQSSRAAVQETRGMVCTWKNQVFCTYYSAVCGGRTTDGREVFKDAAELLKSVPCEWCSESPHYRWTTEISREEFQRRAFRSGSNSKKNLTIRALHQIKEPGRGGISRFELDAGDQRPAVSGVELRDRLPAGTLHSPHFHAKLEKERVIFEGRGHGHGVGFCQWGAKGMAETGRTTAEILDHYFPGVDLIALDY